MVFVILCILSCDIYLRFMIIWVGSRNCGCPVTLFCYQLIAKPGSKTATVPWPDPYVISLMATSFPLLLSINLMCCRVYMMGMYLRWMWLERTIQYKSLHHGQISFHLQTRYVILPVIIFVYPLLVLEYRGVILLHYFSKPCDTS